MTTLRKSYLNLNSLKSLNFDRVSLESLIEGSYPEQGLAFFMQLIPGNVSSIMSERRSQEREMGHKVD